MKKLFVLATAVVMTGCAHVEKEDVHWGYTGKASPEHWGELKPEFATCASGKNQSPVDLKDLVDARLSPIEFAYRAGGHAVVNNGHTIQVNYAPGSSVSLGGKRFELKQFHFHAPSENWIGGKSYPMEAHFVHADKDGNLAVVAVMFREGRENAALAQFWSAMPEAVQTETELQKPVNATAILPRARSYYRFNGSLTTPPCSEGVLWLVMAQPAVASADQIKTFEHIMHHPNNRPIQPLNARAVLK